MKILNLHSWDVTPREAVEIQNSLRRRLRLKSELGQIETIAGADMAIHPEREEAVAGVILYRFPDLAELERVQARLKLLFPYVPGLLAFREGPVLLKAFEKLKEEPDLIFFDGQGIAHPRRMGIAAHLGILLDKPTVGCAKSRLIGEYEEPGSKAGDWSALADCDQIIGAVLRTRSSVRPVFVSPGHKMDLESSLKMTLACCDGYRIPKPTREADHYVGELRKNSRK